MTYLKSIICLLFVSMLSANVSAEDALPRVLIIGDSVYRQPTGEMRKALKGRVEVVHAPAKYGEVCNTSTALEKLDEWLGKEKWDVIHFNFGLGDLVHRAPGMKTFRAMNRDAGGVRATSPKQYEKNLKQILNRLKKTGAKLIWASTTPIRHSSTNLFEMGSEVKYNAIAAKVMAANKVPVNDMYTHVKNLMNMKKPAGHGADPFHFDKKPIHPPVVRAVLGVLKLKEAATRPTKPTDKSAATK